ncbi:MAG: transglycosylase domain-containing protein, partial [Solirubrobacterales bacterium]
ARRTAGGGNGAPAADDAPAREGPPATPPARHTSRSPRRTTRPERNEALSFEGIRARAREMMQGFRESGNRAGDSLRSLREGTGGDGVTTPRRERGGGISPPWRRTPSLPPPPGPRPPSGDGGRPRLKKLRLALVLIGLGLLAMVSWFFGIMMSVTQDLPALENREQYRNAQNSVVLDRNGTQIATLTGNERRIIVPSEAISQTVKQAVVSVEDQRFYAHRGIDYQGIARAVVQDVLQQNTVQGGSTITQQFVKNALRAQDSRTVFQKLREAALAYQLERHWSKDKILTEYLNSIYFGEGAYGIEAAAQTYFGWNHPGCGGEDDTCASQLGPEEAALLAGMISSPSAYSPRANPQAATDRRNLVLQKMADQGVLTPEQYTEIAGDGSVGAGIRIPKPSQIDPPDEDSESPYFTTWLRQQVVDRYGAGEAFGGGLQITSTLDLEYQQAVEGIAYSTLAGIEPTASIVVIDNRTGGVLAMVGGNDYEKEPFNLATNGHRQPGSSWKPFTLVRALEEGHSTEEVFTSQPKSFRFRAPGVKAPQQFEVKNYEDTYYGSQSIASATTTSDNSVYAELGLQVGVKDIASTAEKMGVQTDLSTNPAMILGGLETGVSPLEMAYAYSTLGRSGARIGGTMDSIPGPTEGPLAISKVTTRDADEEPVEDKTGSSGENDVQTEQVLDAGASDTAVGLLESVVSSGTGENAATGDFAWGKTGTTDDNGDAWFVGGTEDVTAAVWVGHPNDVTPMETEYSGGPVDGGTYPADIWHDVVIAYEEIIGSANEEDRAGRSGGSGTTEEVAPPVEEAPAAPVAPAPTEEPVAPAPAPEEEAAPAPAAP